MDEEEGFLPNTKIAELERQNVVSQIAFFILVLILLAQNELKRHSLEEHDTLMVCLVLLGIGFFIAR